MVPGKVYKPEDFLEILWRRKWVAIIPFVLVSVGTVLYTQSLPDTYRSDSRVLIVPQQVPKNYVQSTVTSTLDERLQAISQQILSRTRLERIIQEFDLYPQERKVMLMEDVVARMRSDISLEIPRGRRQDPGFFTVSFAAGNPGTAQHVTERLASMFITENLQDRTVQADQTSQFLQTQLEEARRRLIDHEGRLEAFRRRYSGQLPSQVQSNLQVMQSTQTQLQALIDATNRDHDRQIVLDKMIGDLMATAESAPVVAAVPRAEPRGPAPPPSAAQQLAAARGALASLELRLKPEHPDVIRARRAIRDLEQKADVEALNRPLAPAPEATQPVARLSATDQRRLQDMQTERATIERRIAMNRNAETRLGASIGGYRSRVEAAPAREAELTELTRDYDTLQQSYTTLLTRSEEAKIAADLERRQIGEQFRIIDPARLSERAVNTNRLKLDMIGALAGLGFGIALIALLEYRDTSLRTDDDVAVSLALPVLAVIPVMVTRRERRRSRRRQIAAVSASAVATMGAVGIVLWKFNLLQRWIP